MRISDWSSDVCSSDLYHTAMERMPGSEEEPKGLTRRQLLVGGGAGAGLLLAWGLWPRSYAPNLKAAQGEHVMGAFLKIAEDGQVIVIEIGRTSCRERVCQYV